MLIKNFKQILVSVFSVSVLSACCTEQTCPVTPNPSITNISPTEAAVGESLTINGTNFGENINQTTVKIGGQLADKKSISSTGVVVTVPNVPSGGQAVTVEIGQPARVSNSVNLTVTTATPNSDLSKPLISISSPKEGEKISLPFTALGTASHESGLVKLEYAIDGGVRTPISLQSAALFGIDLKTLFVNGPHELTVFAKGALGTEGQFKRSFVLVDASTLDTTAPTISSVTPSGTAVNKTTAKISVTFNEVMNTSFTAGVISFTLPVSGAPAISSPTWSADSRTLSVTIGALAASTSYKFKIANTVKDLAGNQMVTASEYGFSTTPDTTSYSQPTADVQANINGFYKGDASGIVGPTNVAGLSVGYTVGATGTPDGIRKAFFSFNLPANLPVSKIKSAKLTLVNTPTVSEGVQGDGTNVFGIGNVRIESIVYGAAILGAADFTSAGTSPVNIAALSGLTNIDVTAAVKADVTALRAKSQFRVSLVEPAVRPAMGSWLRLGSTIAPAANQPTLVLEFNP
jgi:Bacterial Ig-like domain/IPT/TIG domain